MARKADRRRIPHVAMPFTDFAGTLQEFLAAIREGRKPETHVEDNVRTLAMVEAAIRSVETDQPVTVGPLVAEALRESIMDAFSCQTFSDQPKSEPETLHGGGLPDGAARCPHLKADR